MSLPSKELEKIKRFLRDNTDYNVDLFLSGKSDHQITAIYQQIKRAMETYPIEILSIIKKNPRLASEIEGEDLYILSYNELARIRKWLREQINTNSKMKVVSAQQVDGTIQRAKEVIRSSKTSHLAANIVAESNMHEYLERDLQILTEAEVMEMYSCLPSNKELADLGIILDRVPNDIADGTQNLEIYRNYLISQLVNIGFDSENKSLSLGELYVLDIEELEKMVNTAKSQQKRLLKEKGLDGKN